MNEKCQLVLWVVIVWCSFPEDNSVLGTKRINTLVCVVSICHDEMPLVSVKQSFVSITHNTFDMVAYAVKL